MATWTTVGRPATERTNRIVGLRGSAHGLAHRAWNLVLAINGTAPAGDVEAQRRSAEAVRVGEEERRAATTLYFWHGR